MSDDYGYDPDYEYDPREESLYAAAEREMDSIRRKSEQEIACLRDELARVTAERDAALDALKEIRRMRTPKSQEEASRQLAKCQVLAFSVEHTDSDKKGSD